MKTTAQAMVLASFAADALALGAHWIYDVSQIDAKFGRMTDFQKPTPPTYHPTKERGDQTHYEDQALVLLQSVAACGGFDEEHFGRSWREFFRTYNGYFDGATKQTLKNMAAGLTGVPAASTSDDLAGAGRIADWCWAPGAGVPLSRIDGCPAGRRPMKSTLCWTRSNRAAERV